VKAAIFNEIEITKVISSPTEILCKLSIDSAQSERTRAHLFQKTCAHCQVCNQRIYVNEGQANISTGVCT
jgi:hypothetical protein